MLNIYIQSKSLIYTTDYIMNYIFELHIFLSLLCEWKYVHVEVAYPILCVQRRMISILGPISKSEFSLFIIILK